MLKCSNPNCSAEIEAGSKFCALCGTPVPQEKECPKCGNQVALAAGFCSMCGYNFNKSAGSPTSNGGLSIGDKNVVAGDVVGSQENFKIDGHATIIKNDDETKKVISCSVCGKNVTIIQAVKCPECGNEVCPDCYDSTRRICHLCIEKNEDCYSKLLREVLEDGVISKDERIKLDNTANKLGLSVSRAKELENTIRASLAQKKNSSTLPVFAEVGFKKALEFLYEDGNISKAEIELKRLYEKFPDNEEILNHYLYAVVKADPKSAKEIISQYTFDAPGIYLARIDLALQQKDFYAAEEDIQSALSKWPGNRLIQYRQVYSLLSAFEEYTDKMLLRQASDILNALPAPQGKFESSWFHKVKFTKEYLEGAVLPDITKEFCVEQNLFTALTQPDIKIESRVKSKAKSKAEDSSVADAVQCSDSAIEVVEEAKTADVQTKGCPLCKKQVPLDAAFCVSCGYNFNAPPKKTAARTLPEKHGNASASSQSLEQKAMNFFANLKKLPYGIYLGSNCPEKKIKNLRMEAEIPFDANIFALHDSTAFGSAKCGVAFTSKGIYGNNDWAVSRPGKFFCSWESFLCSVNTPCISTKSKYEIDLGEGTIFDFCGSGSDRKDTVKMLIKLRDFMAEGASVEAVENRSGAEVSSVAMLINNEIEASSQSLEQKAMNFFANLKTLPFHVYLGSNCLEEKIKNLRMEAEIPFDANLFALHDSTACSSAKCGVAFTSKGIYGNNSSAASRPGKFFCSWESFLYSANTPCISPENKDEIDLGEGTRFEFLGLVSGRNDMVKILINLRDFMAEDASVEAVENRSGAEVSSVAMLINNEIAASSQSLEQKAMNFFANLKTLPYGLYLGSNCPEKKIKNLRMGAEIPFDANLFALYDSTVFGSAKCGVAFTSKGIYGNNDWSASRPGKFFCSWESFLYSTNTPCISTKNKYEIDLGEGTRFYFCGDTDRNNMVKMLIKLRDFMAEDASVEAVENRSGAEVSSVAMLINNEIEATSQKLLEMLESMKSGKVEFVLLSLTSTPDVFIQCCCNQHDGSYHLVYRPDANMYATDTDNFDALKDAMLRFYQYDFSFLNNFSWSLLENN